jgi:hypothetical protein
MNTDTLLSELERQQKYLDALPPDFKFPLFNARHAILSQRRSAYQSTASAAREIIDNSIEAGATRIDVVFDTDRDAGNRRSVRAIAFIDNGSGMLPAMARYALSWGGGTHFEDPSFIGKFGFGLPNASINQSLRAEVYTRIAKGSPFTMTYLDVNEYTNWGPQEIKPPTKAEPPVFVRSYLERNKLPFEHGTIIIWIRPDRLTYKRPARLKEHLVDDFGVVYRYQLARPDRPLEIIVDGVLLKPVDPLFLLPEGRDYVAPEDGGAIPMENLILSVVYFPDQETGEHRLELVRDAVELLDDEPETVVFGTIQVRIARFPIGFAAEKDDSRALDNFSPRRLEIRKPRRGMSFVRANREIATIDVFPKLTADAAMGLGNWPLLQTYAYHWGIEVRFQPILDDVFGITHDKQGVRPIEDFWRVLHEADVDAMLRRENLWQAKQRKRQKPQATSSNAPTPAESAAHAADIAASQEPRVPDHLLPLAKETLHKLAQVIANQSGQPIAEVLQTLELEAKRRRYKIDYFDAEYGPFFRPKWVGAQLVVEVNRKHPFYTVLYTDLLQLPGGSRAKEAVDLLLIALSRAELIAPYAQMTQWYEAQRLGPWSQFLANAIVSLTQRFSTPEEATNISE